MGYGFSSLTVPVALLFYTNRRLNPTLVLIEVALNAYVLWANRSALPVVWRRVLPTLIGLLPGVAPVRFVESALTTIFYLYAGMFTARSLALAPYIIPGVVVGLLLGVLLIRRVPSETFRRICMSLDAWIVGFGFSKVLNEPGIVEGAARGRPEPVPGAATPGLSPSPSSAGR